MKGKGKELLLDSGAIVIGCALAAMGMVAFTIPNRIAPGGVSGLATAIGFVTGAPVGMLSLALNLPVFWVALRVFGLQPLLKTGAATMLLSVLIDLFSLLPVEYTGNTLLAAVLGGALMGAGLGLLLTRGISTGGTDLLGLILRRKSPHLSLGNLMMLLDGAVVVVAVLIFREIEIALYSIVTIFCASKTIDAIVQGVDYAKVIYIITEKPQQIVRELTEDLGRGVTEIFARGGYSGRDKTLIMTAARRSEVSDVLKVIDRNDKGAFVIFLDATEVRGEGFKELSGN